MPADFKKCIKKGGKVITIKPKADTYINVCYDKQGKAHAGEPKKVQQECIDEIKAILMEDEGEHCKRTTCKCGNVMTCRCTTPKIDIFVDSCPSCEEFKEESTTSNATAGKDAMIGHGVMRRVMPNSNDCPDDKCKKRKKKKENGRRL